MDARVVMDWLHQVVQGSDLKQLESLYVELAGISAAIHIKVTRGPGLDGRVKLRPETGQMLSVAQAAHRLSVSEDTIRRQIASGQIKAVRVGTRKWAISESALPGGDNGSHN